MSGQKGAGGQWPKYWLISDHVMYFPAAEDAFSLFYQSKQRLRPELTGTLPILPD